MRKLLLTFCLAFLAPAFFAAAQNGSLTVQEPVPDGELRPELVEGENSLLDAVSMLDSGDYLSAAVVLDSLATVHPDAAEVHYYLALCRSAAGNAPGTLESLENAVRLDPSNIWYRELLASYCVSTGNAERAGELFEGLAKDDPDRFRNVYTLSMMADAYRSRRDYDSLFRVLTDIVTDPYIEDPAKKQAVLGALGGFDSRTLNRLLPRMDSLMVRYTQAEPSSLEAHWLRMETVALLKNNQAVIDECNTMMALAPSDTSNLVSCLSIIGDSYHEMGDSRSAYKAYEKALKLDPRYCPVLNNYAYYLSLERRRLGKAERMSRITIEEEPGNATYLDTYGWILYLRGKPAAAKPYFKSAMAHGGKDSAVILMHYAIVLKALGEDDLAAYYQSLSESKTK